ncbi:MAG: hypothetical protein AAGF12_17925 [Myxococcota bacterium]
MRRFEQTLLITGVFALWCGACGEDSAPTASVPVGSFCAQFAAARCAALARCECPDFASPDSCRSAEEASCPLREGEALRDAIEAGTSPYNPFAAGQLVARVRSASCDAPVDCRTTGVCVGLSGNGGPCGEVFGCGADAQCVGSICERFGGEGASCRTDGDCADKRCVGSICEAPRRLMEPCTMPSDCASGRCAEAMCAEKAPIGTACDVDSECETGRCDFAVGRCSALIANDELCTEDSDCVSGYCDIDMMLAAGFCRSREGPGDACADNDDCQSGLCVSARCAIPICES